MMATQIRIEFDSAGFREILCGPGVGNLVDSKAAEIARACGPGFDARTGLMGNYGGGRHVAYVGTSTFEGRKIQAERNVLGRFVG